MRVSIIVAMSRNYVIGTGDKLPWHLPADLKRFRRLTVDKPIIMGRRTFESIGRPLPERTNIVVTSKPGSGFPGCLTAQSLEVALVLAADDLRVRQGDEAMVIGGTEIYSSAMPFAERIYLTVVEGEFAGGVTFPKAWLHDAHWRVTVSESHAANNWNPYAHRFMVLDAVDEGGATIAEFVQMRPTPSAAGS